MELKNEPRDSIRRSAALQSTERQRRREGLRGPLFFLQPIAIFTIRNRIKIDEHFLFSTLFFQSLKEVKRRVKHKE